MALHDLLSCVVCNMALFASFICSLSYHHDLGDPEESATEMLTEEPKGIRVMDLTQV